MLKNLVFFIANILLLCIVFVWISTGAFANDNIRSAFKDNSETAQKTTGMAATVEVSNAWARATFALAQTGAAYINLSNPSSSPIHLRTVKVNRDVANIGELHHTIMLDDMMKMEALSEGIVIPAGKTDSLQPGGKHIMLMGLSGPLNVGKHIDITLVFEDGSELVHRFPIKDAR